MAEYAGDAFVFALKSDGTKIGAGTTFWLNTDQNTGTGYQIFGFAGGAEYNVNIGSDGKAALYTGAAGEVLVSDTIDYKLSNDGTILELAISSSLLSGAPRSAGLYLDVNDQVFLSNSYANVEYKVAEAVTPPPPAVYGAVTIDGDLADWTAATRLDKPSDGVAGYEVHGQVAGGAFVFALKTDGAKIGPGTTFWLNTDQNAGTGYQIWGFAGGAEYNVNIGPDGKLALYKDGAGQTLVDANIDYRIGADGTTLEFAVPISRLDGAPRVANVLLDVNDQVFLSNDYANTYYRVAEPVTVPDAVAGPKSIAIVYSETTAKNFYDLTAYSQLFMATQHQAMQAGIPFDILSETDLKDAAKLATYSTLVFPGMSHVKASDLAEIDSALRSAVFDHHVGIIAAGNFLTNDETGAALAGDSYARMKAILGVTLEGYGASEGILVHAADTTHPLSSGYAAGETVGTYGNTSFLDFTGRHGLRPNPVHPGGGERRRKPDLQCGDRDTDRWAKRPLRDRRRAREQQHPSAGDRVECHGCLPSVKIQMTRGTSLFAARNDMDQSQETFDVVGAKSRDLRRDEQDRRPVAPSL